MAYYHTATYQINSLDLYARDNRAFVAAGIHNVTIQELNRFGNLAASDALDWRPSDLLKLQHVGQRTVEKIAALIELA